MNPENNFQQTPNEPPVQNIQPTRDPVQEEYRNEQKSAGPIIGIIIVIILLVAGALYVWQTKTINPEGETSIQDYGQNDQLTQQLETTSTSTETEAIEEDLNATDFENLDLDFDAAIELE